MRFLIMGGKSSSTGSLVLTRALSKLGCIIHFFKSTFGRSVHTIITNM